MLRAGVVVSNNTAPLHVAAALEKPVLGFYAPWATCGAQRWGPYADNGWALEAECAEADGWSRRERQRRAAAIMSRIEPQQACRSVVDLLDVGGGS